VERTARSLPISDQRICPLQYQRCPGPCESGHLSIIPPGCLAYLEAAMSSVREFLLLGGRQRHPSSAARSHQSPRLRIPPTWRPPTSSIPSKKKNEQPDHTSHYVLNLCPSQSLNPKDVLSLCPSQSLNRPLSFFSFSFSAANSSYLEAATSSVCEFLLPEGRQRHPSRAARSHLTPATIS